MNTEVATERELMPLKRFIPPEIIELEEAERAWRLTRLIEPIFFGRLQRVQRELIMKVNGISVISNVTEAPAQVGRLGRLWQRVDDFTIGISETMGNSIDTFSFFMKKIVEPFRNGGNSIGNYEEKEYPIKEGKQEILRTRDIGKHYVETTNPLVENPKLTVHSTSENKFHWYKDIPRFNQDKGKPVTVQGDPLKNSITYSI